MFLNKIILVFYVCVPLTLCRSSKIGLISDYNDPNVEIVFDRAVRLVGDQLDAPLKGIVERVTYGNVLDSYNHLCRIFLSGVSLIIGPSWRPSAWHLTNTCDEKEVPYIDTTLDFTLHPAVLNLHPHPQQLARALYDIIASYNWQQFTFLYERGEYLSIFNELMVLYGNDAPTINLRRYDIGLDHSYYNVLRGVKKSKDNSVVVVGSLESLGNLLEQAQEIGIINDEYEYIISNLDFQTLDLRKYLHSECNITAMRIVSPENEVVKDLMDFLGYSTTPELRNITCPVTTNMALIYDAVQIFGEAINHFNFTSERISCADDEPWVHGFTVSNYLSYASTKGITGDIRFNLGLRSQFALEIIQLTTSGLIPVGTWNTTTGLEIKRQFIAPDQEIDPDSDSLVNKTFIVLTALSPPYGMLKNSPDKLTGNDQYEGFGIDLIHMLSLKLGFNYTFRLQEDNDYGSFNVTTKESTGMVKELREGRADLAITDLTITSERALGVDFTIPFMNLGVSILYRKAQKEPPKLFSFMDPFSKEVWLYLGVAYIGVSLSFFILGRLSPTEWDNPYPCIEQPTELENQFSFSNSLWVTIGALLQQGSEIAPKAPSTRTVASIWSFFTIIMVSSYTANLAAFLTVESAINPINDVNDLASNKGGVKYGAKRLGATINFFQSSKKYEKMNDYIKSHPELLTSSNEDGVRKVLTENYAFLMESTSIEYNVERNCNLTQVGQLLDEKGYGIAMKKNWPYRDKLSSALLELQEAGVLSKMKTKWWQEVTDGCSKKKKEAEKAEALGMPNLGGVYFVLLLGSTFAAAFGVVKWVFFTCRRAYFLKVSVKQELLEELKFVVDCSKHTKVVKTTGSSYSRNSSITMESMKEANLDEESARLTR